MIALIQRVSHASVVVDRQTVGEIRRGWLIFLGVGKADDESHADWLADRVTGLRAFPDENGKMNRSVLDIQGEILVVSQFTLLAQCQTGRRPGFSNAASPEIASTLYEYFVKRVQSYSLKVATGQFGAHMDVSLINDGPVTFWLDSQQRKSF
jgi:D-tyrosyl-tRNA(Tyr) deacylase